MKPHIKNLRCFPQVAAVIGESRAQLELWRVVHRKGGKWWNYERGLSEAFSWDDSPQGFGFWEDVALGINPYINY